MAISNKITHLKASYNAYAKISTVSFSEAGSDEKGKLYTAKAVVNVFADNVKDVDLYQTSHDVSGLRLEELTLVTVYEKLKAGDFAGWTDC